jgi:hypothetical protein
LEAIIFGLFFFGCADSVHEKRKNQLEAEDRPERFISSVLPQTCKKASHQLALGLAFFISILLGIMPEGRFMDDEERFSLKICLG